MVPENRSSRMEWLFRASRGEPFRFYCVGCKRERWQSPPAKAGSLKFFSQIAITTAFFSAMFWPWMGFKGVLAFLVPVGLVMEVAYRLKMRGSVACPDCGFDPILYLSDRKKAVRQVEEAWRKKFEEKGIPFPEKPKRSGVRPKIP